ncbi:hypothetical protein GT755_38330 [Herbidospora sp. NEAU-GS84]|uniref:FtsK domain-containing protein n=1 Tax=Herbidospora solisilvae TaxID=2696284 RepID=A0A7C9NCS2_9ACTN|nr:hypothetical protein [Herbidospora solisilvae]NAS27513.1 hypothetical protein [Herbidospora solisilvae]
MANWLFSITGRLLVWLAKQLARLIAWLAVQAFLHPRTSLTVAAAAGAVSLLGWKLCLLIGGSVLVTLSTWKAAHPESFSATVATWSRSWWRRWWLYRRTWAEVFTACGLAVQADKEVVLPKLKGVRSSAYWDFLLIEMRVGQAPRQFESVSDELRLGFKGQRIVLKEMTPRLLSVSLMRRDPLVEVVPATAIPARVEDIDWKRVPVGVDEFGDPYTVSLTGGHTAVSGSTGAGKAGLEWNVLRHLGPAIAAGWVRVVAIDPKQKELRRGLGTLFSPENYAAKDEAVLALLERLVAEMNETNEREGEAGERDFRPGPGRPLTLILLDEMAPLFKYWPRRIRDKIEDALGLLLTQGRAAGFSVLGAIQEPTKDVFQMRDLFTRRLALRLPKESHTEAALTEDAVKYGALCHQISESTPGVLYSLQDGARSTTRARLGWVDDAAIDELIAYVQARQNVIELDGWGGSGRKPEVAA